MSGGSMVLLLAVLLIVLPALLLAIPLRLEARVARDDALAWRIDLRWLFGLVRLQRNNATLPGTPGPQGADPSSTSPEPQAGGSDGIMALLLDPPIWPRGLRTLRSVLRGLTWRLEGRIEVGLEDPADTGRLFGLLQPLLHAARNVQPRSLKVDLAPDFARTGIAGHLSAALRLVPLRTLAPLVPFGLWLAVHRWRRRT